MRLYNILICQFLFIDSIFFVGIIIFIVNYLRWKIITGFLSSFPNAGTQWT